MQRVRQIRGPQCDKVAAGLDSQFASQPIEHGVVEALVLFGRVLDRLLDRVQRGLGITGAFIGLRQPGQEEALVQPRASRFAKPLAWR